MTEGLATGRTIVVGVDASPAAGAALRWAIEYARPLDAEVVAVHAFEAPFFFAYSYGDATRDTLEATLREGVRRCFEEDWCAPLAAAGVRHRKVMEDGRAARVLLDVADREAADLVVTGRRGLNTLGELVLGSVSHNLVHASRRPVVLVPAAELVATDVERRDG
jgi:nucleotide-binding universal stress UspA family protein